MLLETILVAALLPAYLAVPSQTLKAFRFHLVCDVLRASHFCLRHDGDVDSVFRWFLQRDQLSCWKKRDDVGVREETNLRV